MGWGWKRDWHLWGMWPGRGPWSWLPPPLRPGWHLWQRWWPCPWPFATREEELRYLEEMLRYLDEVKRQIEERIAELKKELGK